MERFVFLDQEQPTNAIRYLWVHLSAFSMYWLDLLLKPGSWKSLLKLFLYVNWVPPTKLKVASSDV